ncbi:sensor histidine kinase [Brevundimonas sp.]|uniref:sensor histidine kinase n=1 Tax=Brevundimonas sp. TaxID=1871086 RepID=UPI0025C26A51|nr:HAMP domain-containing sensor histidine kinase [Brevundimonas sp.]
MTATVPQTAVRPQTGARPVLAAWHAAWALLAALIALGGRLLGAAGLEDTVLAGLLVLAAPGAAGLALLWRDGPGPRALVLVVWCLAATAVAGLTGGLSGPLAAAALTPLAAGLILDRARLMPIAGLGAAAAIAAGLASAALAGPGPSAPVVAALVGFAVVAAALAAARLSDRHRQVRRAATDQALTRAEGLLTTLPALTLVLEPGGRILAAYGAAPPALPVDSLFAQGLIAAVHAPDRPAVLSALDKAVGGRTTLVRFAPRLALDRRIVLAFQGQDAPAPGGRIVALAFDDTAQYAHEVALETARAEAEAHSAGKTRFLANMSHELRTPLNAVLGFSDMMRQSLFGPLPPRYAEYAVSIHEAGNHLLDLINDVLDVSKIEAERYELVLERFDARETVSAAVALVRIQAVDKGLDLAVVQPGDPVEVAADRRALKQIALNLLSNALKFNPAGGSVTLTLEAVGPYLELVVADTGVGIAPDDIARLGRPFEQAGAADQKSQGTGLGLSLVRSLAELHGGRMTVDSTLGEGTAITVRLPVVTGARPSPPADGGQVVPLIVPA